MATETLTRSAEKNMPPESLPLYKKLIYGFVSAMFAIALIVIVGEVFLRVVPLGRFKSSPFRQYDAVLGLSLVPNLNVIHNRGCFQGLIQTNQWGFRDRERTLEKPAGTFRIAVIGDSMVEAVHVRPEQVINIQMEDILRKKGYKNTEVLAFGIGGIGTTQEWILYQEKVRQFHPDVVLVMFSENDIMNNSSTLQNEYYGIHTWYCPYYNLQPDGSLAFQPVQRMFLRPIRMWLENHSLMMYYGERLWFDVDYGWGTWRGIPLVFGAFSDDPPDPEWQKAWTVTEKVVAKMRDSVNADGAKFMVMIWATQFDLYPDVQQRAKKEFGSVPAGFNPPKYNERLQTMMSRENVPAAFLAPYMQAYRDANNVQPPYFSLPCDPHYSPLGHQVSAEAVVDIMQKNQLLPPL